SRFFDASFTCQAFSPCIPFAIRHVVLVLRSLEPPFKFSVRNMKKRPNPDFPGKSAPIAWNVASWRGV
ncbi:hypothetical protein ACE04B_04680, partial [Rhizobium phaseoli]